MGTTRLSRATRHEARLSRNPFSDVPAEPTLCDGRPRKASPERERVARRFPRRRRRERSDGKTTRYGKTKRSGCVVVDLRRERSTLRM